jgi:hypothetical protein
MAASCTKACNLCYPTLPFSLQSRGRWLLHSGPRNRAHSHPVGGVAAVVDASGQASDGEMEDPGSMDRRDTDQSGVLSSVGGDGSFKKTRVGGNKEIDWMMGKVGSSELSGDGTDDVKQGASLESVNREENVGKCIESTNDPCSCLFTLHWLD